MICKIRQVVASYENGAEGEVGGGGWIDGLERILVERWSSQIGESTAKWHSGAGDLLR